MQDVTREPGRLAVLERLDEAARAMYGGDRAREPVWRAALELTATAVWRLSEEPLTPSDVEPLTHV